MKYASARIPPLKAIIGRAMSVPIPRVNTPAMMEEIASAPKNSLVRKITKPSMIDCMA